MKLTANEVKLLSDIAAHRKRRKRDAWVSFLLVIAVAVASFGYGMFPQLVEWPILGIAIGMTSALLIHVYFGRPTVKINLLSCCNGISTETPRLSLSFRMRPSPKQLPPNHALHLTLDPARLALPLQATCVKCG
ncbi:MAG: hypothetical protein U5K38_14480 [Woeseiaceae bacterium]|nr:hypothetical protein [Woeseiaceae bacterium]